MSVNFTHNTDIDKSRTFHVKSDNVEFRMGSDTDDVVTKLLDSFFVKYEYDENILRDGSNYSFDYVDMSAVHFHEIKLKRGGSYIDSPTWIKNKGDTINPKNTKGNKCFQFAIIAAIHNQFIGPHPERISKLRPYIDNCNWKDINFPAGPDDWRIFERSNKDVALNIYFVPYNKEKINIAYRSDHNRKRKKQVILLIISDNEKEFLKDGYYLALKSISTTDGLLKPTRSISRLLSGIASNHHGNFYCMNCSHAFYSEKALGKHEELCDNHKFCKPVMPYKSNILQYSSGEKVLKVPHSIYFDLESLLIPHQSPHNNPDKSYTEKKATHEPCSYAINLAKTYGKNKCVKYRGKDCMKNFVNL